MGDIKKGDRVRVVIEGVVTYAHPSNGYDIAHEDGRSAVCVFEPGLDGVEKIEPPVEVFKPGDVVRGRLSRFKFTIGENGYFDHLNNRVVAAGPYDTPWTSKHFERVSPDSPAG